LRIEHGDQLDRRGRRVQREKFQPATRKNSETGRRDDQSAADFCRRDQTGRAVVFFGEPGVRPILVDSSSSMACYSGYSARE
jgi:hypothetical protein